MNQRWRNNADAVEQTPKPKNDEATSTLVVDSEHPWPDLSYYPQEPIQHIKIPDEFRRTKLNRKNPTGKTRTLCEQVAAQDQLDELIVVRPTYDHSGYILDDGSRHCLVAVTLGWHSVPVDIRPKDNSENQKATPKRDTS